MQLDIYDTNGKLSGQKFDLIKNVFGARISKASIYYALKNELANKRVGTADTKTRAEVKGSGKKPYRQKGTGRARAGSKKSPLWRSGGVAFGPHPRDYSYRIPKKLKRVAIRSVLTFKRKNNQIKIIDDFTVEDGKTRKIEAILRALVEKPERTLLIYNGEDKMVKRAIKNISWASAFSCKRLAIKELYYAHNILIMSSAAEELNKMYNPEKEVKEEAVETV